MKTHLWLMCALISFLFFNALSNPTPNGYIANVSEGEIVALDDKPEYPKYRVIIIKRNKADSDFGQQGNDVIHLYLRSLESQPTYAIGQFSHNGKVRRINYQQETSSQETVKKRMEQFSVRKQILQQYATILYPIEKQQFVLDSVELPKEGMGFALYKKENWFSTQWVQQCAT